MNNANDESKFYYGVSETPFKERFRNHTKEFKHAKYRNSTELSKYIWKLKDASITPLVPWEIAAKVYSKTKIDYCKLCLTEKLFIINCFNDHRLLNKKSELAIHVDIEISYCSNSLKIKREMIQWINTTLFKLTSYFFCEICNFIFCILD